MAVGVMAMANNVIYVCIMIMYVILCMYVCNNHVCMYNMYVMYVCMYNNNNVYVYVVWQCNG
jgi:hypothetical protein